MIDDDDVSWFALFWPWGGWIGAILGLLIIAVLGYVACQNDRECEARVCPEGERARLLGHECMCIRAAP
jgi:hypothetical protein